MKWSGCDISAGILTTAVGELYEVMNLRDTSWRDGVIEVDSSRATLTVKGKGESMLAQIDMEGNGGSFKEEAEVAFPTQ